MSHAMLASSSLRAPAPFTHATASQSWRLRSRPLRLVARAQAADASDDDFEARLSALKKAKGQTPIGEGKKKDRVEKARTGGKREYDFSNETLYLETSPSYGDLAVNVALGITLVWLPLTLAAVGRTAFVRYRFTDRRLSVITNAPWESKQLDAAYQEVQEVRAIGRGVGAWGDMVVELRNGDKVEMRAVPRWQELRDYIQQRAKELRAAEEGGSAGSSSAAKGFAA